MTDAQFSSFLNLMMCSDPWPITDVENDHLTCFADMEAAKRGYGDWIEAYHAFRAGGS